MSKANGSETNRSERGTIMKTFLKSILFTSALVISTNSVMAMQMSNSWYEQWHKAKYGRSSPPEEARLNAERAAMAYREETAPKAAIPRNTWFEDFHRAKYGRSSPLEEARLKAERAATAYREEAAPKAGKPADTWLDDFWSAKYGRPAPRHEGR